jgi:hypothetical protein
MIIYTLTTKGIKMFLFGRSNNKGSNTNTGFAIFFAGSVTNAFSPTNYVDKYSYSANTNTSGENLATSSCFSVGVGNSTFGIMFLGDSGDGYTFTTTTNKYTYSTDIVNAGNGLGLGRGASGGAGNSTLGIITGGYNNNQYGSYSVNYTDIYTYSTDVVSVGSNLIAAKALLAGVGNDAYGIFGGGDSGSSSSNSPYGAIDNYNTTDIYNYSTNGVVAGTALGLARSALAAAGNKTFGVFYSGLAASATNYIDIYTYSNNAVVAGTSLGTSRGGLAGSGNSNFGLFVGGMNSSNVTLKNTEQCIYSNNSVIAGSNLSVARLGLGGLSSTPGGL